MKNINIIVGHYGSGKTEFSINLAVKSDADILVDFDIVNPYIRSADARGDLAQKNIQVIASEYVNSNVDVPALPSEIYSVFHGGKKSVFDVGGDDDGAIALGRFHDKFDACGYEMLMVYNAHRPLTRSADEIIEYIGLIEAVSSLKVTGLVNNTNIMDFTTEDIILEGQKLGEEVYERTGLPVKYISGKKEFLDKLPKEYDSIKFPIDIYMKKPWEMQ
ncbi:MAG: hypothetical protein PHE51_02850 [Eubacteriales bacterium]|nr:hypothetical protein [Eubacteriales bacterium]